MAWEQNDRNRSYTFEYDKISRLTEARYKGLTTEDYSTTYSYDKHGNMKTLTRMGMVNNTPGLLDDLSFDYTGNQRLSVEDHIQDIIDNSSMDFKDYNKKADIPVEYTYNTNGAMTMDLNKGVQNIKYNILNLPQEVEIEHPTAKAKNYYTYTATGTKLKVVHQNDVLQKSAPAGAGSQENELHTIDYVGNIIYEDGILDKILFDNGYYQDGNYYFYVRDHLGNNQLVADAAAAVVQSNHYYPFGMSFAESAAGEKQPYKYNNKELDDRAGLNWYDYSARMKDDWGFMTMDPLAEKYYSISPYAYVANNPMKYVDYKGDSISLAGLQAADKVWGTDYAGTLKNDLQTKTGLTYTIGSDGQMTYGKDSNGNPIIATTTDGNGNVVQVGSITARNLMISSIDNTNTVTVGAGTRSQTDGPANAIGLSFSQIEGFMQGTHGLDNTTMGWGMTFMHELSHTNVGGGLSDAMDWGNVGAVETRMNTIRTELNGQGKLWTTPKLYGNKTNAYRSSLSTV